MKKLMNFIVTSCKKQWWLAIVFTLSPTLLLAAFSKDNKESKDEIRELIIRRNWQYFIATPVVALMVGWIAVSVNWSWLLVIGGLYALSRVNEIFYAFINDATSHLKTVEHSSSLKYYERIPLAMRSYLELILLYGIISFVLHSIYQSLNCGMALESCSLNMMQSIYYSGVTITTLGYGEITPNDVTSQFMSIYEVINGFSLIVVSFAVYVSKSVSMNEYKTP